MDEMIMGGASGNGRRRFLQGVAMAAAGAMSAPALAQQVEGGTTPVVADDPHKGHKMPAPPDTPVMALLVYPKMVMQDLIGPLTVFNLMRGSQIHLVWKDKNPVTTELGVTVAPTTTLADCPKDVDVLFVPGGLEGTIALMDDPEVLAFLADRGARAKYVTADCTGSLLLGAAGLLRGYKATSHWMVRDELRSMGAIPVRERVVIDRNRITGGGVTAGIDFGLTLCALMRGEAAAQNIQLIIEYAPAPPFNAGTPETAPPEIVNRLLTMRGGTIERARVKAVAAGAKF
jgi:cyclohexyl-isocyanide hydratase